MLIDILFLVLLVLAVFKGLQRGLIVGVFSLPLVEPTRNLVATVLFVVFA